MDLLGARSGGIGSVLATWEQSGVFDYLLPFLLIFALIFGILSRIQLFKDNRAITSIISLVVGLMALQFEFVSVFFAEVFPRLGVALSIILVLLIMTGIFIDKKSKGLMWGLFAVGVIIAAVVLINSGEALGWSTGKLWAEDWHNIVLGIIVVAFVVAIVFSGGKKSDKPGSIYEALGFSKDD